MAAHSTYALITSWSCSTSAPQPSANHLAPTDNVRLKQPHGSVELPGFDCHLMPALWAPKDRYTTWAAPRTLLLDESAKRGLRPVYRLSHQLNADETVRHSNSSTYRVNTLVCALSWYVSYTDSR